MVEKVSEKSMVIYYQFVYYCSVDILRGELVLVTFFYYLSHFCEVTRDCRGVSFYYHVVVKAYVL